MRADVLLLGIGLLHLTLGAHAKEGCEFYFGADAFSNSTGTGAVAITVADPDVTEGFPYGASTFVHRSGALPPSTANTTLYSTSM